MTSMVAMTRQLIRGGSAKNRIPTPGIGLQGRGLEQQPRDMLNNRVNINNFAEEYLSVEDVE